jgi:hypothetical protein
VDLAVSLDVLRQGDWMGPGPYADEPLVKARGGQEVAHEGRRRIWCITRIVVSVQYPSGEYVRILQTPVAKAL